MKKNNMRPMFTMLFPLLLAGTGNAVAESMEQLPADQLEEYQQLLELLDEQTTIATKTRLNADYVPGMVTVLHGSEVESSGSRTVWEALAKVPGIELSIEESGRKQVVIRGLGRTYASGNVKIMLNGMAMNAAHNAHATPVLNIPIEQVERIEVIRGPGSALYGEYAYSGVINVITRSGEDKLFVRGAEGQHRGGGGIYSYRASDSDLAIDLNLSHWREDDSGVDTGEDILYATGDEAFSNAPGVSNEAQRDTTALLSVKRNGYRLNLQWLEDGYGDHFGINEELPPDDQRIVTRSLYQGVELGKYYPLSDTLSTDIHAALLNTEEEKERQFLTNTEDYVAPYQCFPPCVMNGNYTERRNNVGVDINWDSGEQHRLLFSYGYSDIKVRESSGEVGPDGGAMIAFDPLITAGTRRRIHNLTLQDEYRPSRQLTLTAGLRHDDYSDIGNSTTPRLAAVYRLGRQHIFKAQYARAFRPPTFYELGGAIGEIDPAIIDTYEAGYIYKGVDTEWRLTLFHSELENPIAFVTEPQMGFVNVDKVTLYGTELEWDHRLNKHLSLNGNLSWLHSENRETDNEPLAGSSDWLANLGLDIKPDSNALLNLHYRYAGEVHREVGDDRDPLGSYSTLDMTFNWMAYLKHGYTLRLGVKNALDEDVVYPAPMETYPEDRPRQGRLWWAGMSYQL